MRGIFDLLAALVQVYIVLLIVRAILSWLPPGSDALATANRLLGVVTEPVLRPARRLIPPLRTSGGAIDLSLVVVVIVLELIVLPLLRA